MPPLVIAVHTLPAQQPPAAGSHAVPAGMHDGAPPSAPPLVTQTRSPGAPSHVPAQQSPLDAQSAPMGAQPARQRNAPDASGRQWPEQQSCGAEQAAPFVAHAAPEAQRDVAVEQTPEQQSPLCAQ